MNVTRFDPFNELVDDLFKGFLVRPLAYEGRDGALPRMKVDVTEKNGAYTVTAELPGVKKEEIQVSIDGAQVTLAAEVKREKEVAQDERVLHTERTFGKVTRSFSLPQEVDEALTAGAFGARKQRHACVISDHRITGPPRRRLCLQLQLCPHSSPPEASFPPAPAPCG